jgi:hypothetical protein
VPAAPRLAPTSCIGLAVDPRGRIAGSAVVDAADPASSLELRDDGLYSARLLHDRCAVRYGYARYSDIDKPDPVVVSEADRLIVTFTHELVDTAGMFDPQAPDKVTIQTGGFYLVSATATRLAASATTPIDPHFIVEVMRSSPTTPSDRLIGRDYTTRVTADTRRGASVLMPVDLAAGDVLQVRVSLDPTSGLPGVDPVTNQPITTVQVEYASLCVLAWDTE